MKKTLQKRMTFVKSPKYLHAILTACLATGLVLPMICSAQSAPAAQASTGAIVGIVANAAKSPVAHATVTALKAGGGIRATISGGDGVYSFSDLAPGAWILTASVDGSPDISLPAVQVAANKATRLDIVMNTPATATSPAAVAAAAIAAPAATAASSSASIASTIAPASAAAPDLSFKEKLKQWIPEALMSPEAGPAVDNETPFAFGDFTWLNGSPRNKTPVFDTKFFTPDIRLDVHYMQDFNGPKDHTIVGSTESFRSGEFQVEQISLGRRFSLRQRARAHPAHGWFVCHDDAAQ